MNRIGLIGENSIEYIDKLLDIWNNGDCAVLIDWRIPFQTVVEMMNEASVDKCYIEKKVLEKVSEEQQNGIEFISFEKNSYSAQHLPDYIYDRFRENYSRDEAIILYSSGTTGKAKGIILSHYAINTNADAIIDYMQPQKNDCIYIAKTLSHSSTLTGELLVAMKAKIRLVITPTVVPPRFVLKTFNTFSVSIICINPTLLALYTEEQNRNIYSIKSLKTIYVSGSILNDKTYMSAHNIFEGIAIYNVYGLSEASPRVTAQREGCCKSNSVGKPIKNVELKIINVSGHETKKGDMGNIYIKTPSLFTGYVTKNKKIDSNYFDWFNTGDTGYIDEYDELHIVGRQDDLIIINSYKVYPYFIENILLTHNNIGECKVLHTEKYGLTCVYTKTTDRDIKKELTNLLNNTLASYEIPEKFLCIEYFPKTNTGKINVNEIKRLIIGD